jgi:hypothetical protein
MPLEIQRLAETMAQYVKLAPTTDERETEPVCAGKASARAPLPPSPCGLRRTSRVAAKHNGKSAAN